MSPKIPLSAITDAIDLQGNEFSAYLNRETHAIEQISDDLLSAIEDNDNPQELIDRYGVDEQEITIAREIMNGTLWLPLPSRYDINEYEIMERFCLNQKNQDLRDRLLSAIHGKGAFRRFKDTAERSGVLEQWYEFKNKEIKEIAREWCKENGVECE
jgi:predicted nucleotidyltransferase